MEPRLKDGTDVQKRERVSKEAVATGCYLGFFVSGAMVLSRIDEILQGAPHIVALEPRHIFVPQAE